MADALSVALRQAGPIPLDIAFTCAPGECVAIVGPSGAGKTTVLRAIAGLYRPRAGRVACGDVWLDTAAAVDVAPHLRSVGLVFQGYALFPHLSVLEHVRIAMSHRPARECRARARDLLARVGLQAFAARKPAALSGGQQQRVALARALARDPAALLLDEPFSALDCGTRRRLREDVARLGMPTVLVTHDLDEVRALADQVVMLEAGATVRTGTPAEVLDGF